MATDKKSEDILVLGLGELGMAIIDAFLSHDLYSRQTMTISVLVRPATLAAPTMEKAAQLARLESQGIIPVGGDLDAASVPELTVLFAPFHTIIHAGGMVLSPGTQLKVTQAVLATGTNKFYIPWQFGVDYDVITRSGGQGMFTEQLDVRDLLRSQNDVQWVIVACGIFMSFLFQDFWGVIERDEATKKIAKVRALGTWNDLLTATTAEDIGKCTVDVVLAGQLRNQSIYIAGDSLTYSEFADVIERSTGSAIERELWSTDHLRNESEADPGDKLKKYRVVFSEGKGLAWPKQGSYNEQKNIDVTGFEEYVRSNQT